MLHQIRRRLGFQIAWRHWHAQTVSHISSYLSDNVSKQSTQVSVKLQTSKYPPRSRCIHYPPKKRHRRHESQRYSVKFLVTKASAQARIRAFDLEENQIKNKLEKLVMISISFFFFNQLWNGSENVGSSWMLKNWKKIKIHLNDESYYY